MSSGKRIATSPGENRFHSLDEALLRFTARYVAVLGETYARGVLAGASAKNALDRLRDTGHLQTGGRLGKHAYYQLTKLGARAVGAPSDRAEAPGDVALASHLAIQWFCFFDGNLRFRIENSELLDLLGLDPSEAPSFLEETEDGAESPPLPRFAPHCIEKHSGRPRTYRVYIPSSAKLGKIVARADELAREAEAYAGRLCAARLYGLAILLPSARVSAEHGDLATDVLKALKRAGVHERLYVRVARVPSDKTLGLALREHRARLVGREALADTEES